MLILKELKEAEVFGTKITAQSFDVKLIAPNVVVVTTLLDGSGTQLPPELENIPLLLPQQTHSLNVAVVEEASALYSHNSNHTTHNPQLTTPFPETDALITAQAGLSPGVRTADCMPVILADPETGIVGAVHAGWKGTVGGILRRAVDKMIAQGAEPQRIIVYFGAAICEDCFEVGPEVAEKFREAALGSAIAEGRIDPLTGKPHPNSGLTASLVKANLLQISDIIPVQNIILSRSCTRHQPSKFPSWRRDGATASRLVTAVVRL